MAEVIGIITGIYTSGQALENFATQIRKWQRLSERLLDIREELYVAEIAVKNWKRKYRVENQPGNIKQSMLKVIFGREGAEHITTTLGTIATLVKVVRKDINALIGRAVRVRPGKMQLDDADDGYDEQLVEDCLRRIKQNLSWSQKFVYSVFGKADELEKKVNRLDHKIGVLERLSDLSLETEHPGIYEEMKRMPGRKIIPKLAETGDDGAEKHLRMRKYAELLHKTSRASQNRAHVGLSVPRVDNKDFDFLLNVNGSTQEVIVRPVRFKTGRSPTGAMDDFEAAFPTMRRLGNGDDALYIQPSMTGSDGFKVTLPALTNLVDLEHKESLSAMIRDQGTNVGSQILYSQDQSAVASGIARGSYRLIGSQWLNLLDCTNIRWRRTRDSEWTSMLTATNGNRAITKELDACLAANFKRGDRRDLTKHAQIFRIGLVLAELALKQPISYVYYDATMNKVKLFINGDEEVDAVAMASLVDKKSNVLLGNMILFCLNALQDQDVMASQEIEVAYYRGVTKDARELESLVRGRRRNRSPATT